MDFVRRVLLGVFVVAMLTCVPPAHLASVGWAQEPATLGNAGGMNPKPVQFLPPTAWICQTPMLYCQLVSPLPVGAPCYCLTPMGPVWGFAR